VCFGVPPREGRSLKYSSEQPFKFLVKLGKSGNEIRGDVSASAMKKTAVYEWVKLFLREEKVSLKKRDPDGQQKAELKKTLQKFVTFCVKIVGCLSGA
jgi:hypothetical protein